MGYRLGINLGFAINRYMEPEAWSKIVSEDLGLHYVQFVADLLNPFLPKDYVDAQIKRIVACKEHCDSGGERVHQRVYTGESSDASRRGGAENLAGVVPLAAGDRCAPGCEKSGQPFRHYDLPGLRGREAAGVHRGRGCEGLAETELLRQGTGV